MVLEALVGLDMASRPNHRKLGVLAVVARRERLSLDARHLMLLRVGRVVRHSVDARLPALVAGLEDIADFDGHGSRIRLFCAEQGVFVQQAEGDTLCAKPACQR